jgi:uncharacterized protein YjbI with pentapeptide repeats
VLIALQATSSGSNPAVTAAWIAAGVSVLTLLGTVGVQAFGIRRVSRDTTATARATLAGERLRTLNERFGTAADRLGTDRSAPVRLAAVYAMAGVADDWPENRQTCVDVLCAYLRMPYSPDPGDKAHAALRLAFEADREVRHTVIRVIGAHLRPGASTSWRGLNLDFTGVRFDGGDFGGAEFCGGRVSFDRAEFAAGEVIFARAKFSGGAVSFLHAQFSGARVWLGDAEFSGGRVLFTNAEFSGGEVMFSGARFSAGSVSFADAKFSGGEVYFAGAKFSGGEVFFADAEFSGSEVFFILAEFAGGSVSFSGASFSGGTADFKGVRTWSHPPAFDFAESSPPAGVLLPPSAGADLPAH